ncbi:13779_t:CDS:2, partial [Gigaspora margarita]
MVCFHINEIIKKIDFMASRIGDYDSTIYRKLNSIVNEKDIGVKHVVTSKGFIKNEEEAQATYSAYDFHYIPDTVVNENLEEMRVLIEECNCQKKSEKRDEQKKKEREFSVIYWQLGSELAVEGMFDLSMKANTEMSKFSGPLDKKKFKDEKDRGEKKKAKQIEFLTKLVNGYLNRVKGDRAPDGKEDEKELGELKKLSSEELQEDNYHNYENQALIEYIRGCCKKKTARFKNENCDYEGLETAEEKIELLEALLANQKIFQEVGKQECNDDEKDLIKIVFNKIYKERTAEIDDSIVKL